MSYESAFSQVSAQLRDPCHVLIETSRGRFICHAETALNGSFARGQPIRFTRMAAERIIKREFPRAKMVGVPE
jgi:hypothetical protein